MTNTLISSGIEYIERLEDKQYAENLIFFLYQCGRCEKFFVVSSCVIDSIYTMFCYDCECVIKRETYKPIKRSYRLQLSDTFSWFTKRIEFVNPEKFLDFMLLLPPAIIEDIFKPIGITTRRGMYYIAIPYLFALYNRINFDPHYNLTLLNCDKSMGMLSFHSKHLKIYKEIDAAFRYYTDLIIPTRAETIITFIKYFSGQLDTTRSVNLIIELYFNYQVDIIKYPEHIIAAAYCNYYHTFVRSISQFDRLAALTSMKSFKRISLIISDLLINKINAGVIHELTPDEKKLMY